MNIQFSNIMPMRPSGLINRGAEVASRLGGVVSFFVCLVAVVYYFAS